MDLPPQSTLPWTPGLLRAGVAVVPAIHRWCTAPATIPSEALVSQLAGFAPRQRVPWDRGPVVLLLDGNRAGASRRANRRAFDNRYHQNTDLLPSPDLLSGLGYRHSVWMSDGPLAADLAPYIARLEESQISVEVDLVAVPGH